MIKPTNVAQQVAQIYDEYGWSEIDGVTHDARACEDLRPAAVEYVSKCRLRILRHLPPSGERILDLGSGPIQYPEYLTYSEHFRTRVCVDLSARGLEGARKKLGDRGEYLCGNFLELDVPENSVDAAVSLHVLYHIHKDQQAEVVRKLIRVVKPGTPVVIVYSNPAYPPAATIGRIRRFLKPPTSDLIYFHRHRLSWWRQFDDEADVAIFPWRTLTTREQKLFFPNNSFGKRMFSMLFRLEDRFPKLFRAVACYPMIVLRKKS